MATITDLVNGYALVPGVVPKLNYRSDITSGDAQRWIVSAIRNISDNYPFEELCLPGPIVPLIVGQASYPISYFTNAPVNITRFDSFWVQLAVSDMQPQTLSTITAIRLKWRAISTVSPLSLINGMPVMYTFYGKTVFVSGNQNVIVAFNPDQAYNVQANYQQKHPFVDGINDTIQLPDAWLEVVATAAALIGAEENRMSDKIQTLKVTLYGDPANPKQPGLIKELINARAQAGNVNERQLTFVAGDR